jgi:hypothetical protein
MINRVYNIGFNNEIDVFQVALVGLDHSKEEWLVDIGASCHVSGKQSVFSNLKF